MSSLLTIQKSVRATCIVLRTFRGLNILTVSYVLVVRVHARLHITRGLRSYLIKINMNLRCTNHTVP